MTNYYYSEKIVKRNRNGAISDSFLKWLATIGTAILLGLLGWIGLNIADIPVIKNEITQIKEGMSAQVQINVKRLDDHEARLRNLESGRR